MLRWFHALMPKEERFFDLFARHSHAVLAGAKALRAMMEGGEAQTGQGPGNNGRDPLGRPDRSNRPDLGLSVKVPDEIDIQRAREVLDELRRRLGDPSRPTIELDYLERLIKPF